MSIGKRVFESITKTQEGDTEGAFFQICAALEDTARREYQAKGKRFFKLFVTDNLLLITKFCFSPGGIAGLRVAYSHPQIKSDAKGLCGIDDVIYHAIRCGLYHEGKLPDNLKFGPERAFRPGMDGSLYLPQDLVMGVTLAVVLSPVNAGESLPEERYLQLHPLPLPFSKLWGRRQEVTWLLDLMIETQAAYEREKALAATSPTAVTQ